MERKIGGSTSYHRKITCTYFHVYVKKKIKNRIKNNVNIEGEKEIADIYQPFLTKDMDSMQYQKMSPLIAAEIFIIYS